MTLDEKYSEECKAVGFEHIGRGSRSGYSVTRCLVCGHVDDYQQAHIRAARIRCKECQIAKYKSAAKDGWEFINHIRESRETYVNLKHECCDDLVKVHVGAYLKGKYSCPHCQITKYKQAAKPGWTFVDHFCDGKSTYVNLKHSCGDDLVKVRIGDYLNGKYSCPHCQITKYKQAAKPGWAFVDHFCDGKSTYVNLKHSCGDDLVKVHASAYIRGSYDCQQCMHTHYNDQSYFYVIQVGDIIKLGISNRPDQRYTQYGLPDDATIIEHLRIPLESKRDALVVESHAKQLVKDFKIPTEISKQVFTKEGFNECYTIDSLDLLLTI